MSGSSAGHAKRVLNLYKRILQTGSRWEGSIEDKKYIAEEARKLFRQRKNASIEEADDLFTEGVQRYEYAVHYGIPYPRIEHETSRYVKERLDRPAPDHAPAQQAGSSNDRLEAALKRLDKGKERKSPG